jgi:hypothetical protein
LVHGVAVIEIILIVAEVRIHVLVCGGRRGMATRLRKDGSANNKGCQKPQYFACSRTALCSCRHMASRSSMFDLPWISIERRIHGLPSRPTAHDDNSERRVPAPRAHYSHWPAATYLGRLSLVTNKQMWTGEVC